MPPESGRVVLTPFRPDGKIDFPAYRKLLEYYIAEGVAGLFAVCLSSELYQLTPSNGSNSPGKLLP